VARELLAFYFLQRFLFLQQALIFVLKGLLCGAMAESKNVSHAFFCPLLFFRYPPLNSLNLFSLRSCRAK
jgi:hypothetical protein